MNTTTNETGDALQWYYKSFIRWSGKYTGEEKTIRPSKSNGLIGDKVFLLSAEEVTNEDYGFANNADQDITSGEEKSIYPVDINKRCHMANSDNSSWWWLRSALSANNANISGVRGAANSGGTGSATYTSAVRFALNIPLDKIVYTSPAVSSIAAPGFVEVPETTPTESKLTILDSSRSEFSVQVDLMASPVGEPLSVSYSGAQVGENEYISAIIKDADTGKALYYGYFDQCEAESGNIQIEFPEDIELGTYKIIFMNEQRNADKYTNYAGCSEITLTLYDDKAPVVTNVYKNASNTRFRLTASDNVGLGKITTEDEVLIDDTVAGQTNVTKSISSITTNSLKVLDSSNNARVVSNIILDNVGPVVESITYEDGNYTIRVVDSQSGLWKITNNTGDVIYERYDGISSGT